MKKYDVFELQFQGKANNNPFVDYDITGEFISTDEHKTVSGFYDGNGVYRIRFMPSFEGEYKYRIYGSFCDNVHTGNFNVCGTDSHGMVHTKGMHFRYSDGIPYYSIGTTCYGWSNQTLELQSKTLETLKNSAFNKIRFCIFPKHYDYNYRDPIAFPYDGTPVDNSHINKYNFNEYKPDNTENHWDFSRFNTDYFRMLDKNIEELMSMGIEADIILFHPYDRWGFSKMPSWADDLYLKYVTARYSAYRNIWWSLANEYDLFQYKTIENWEHYASVVTNNDPYNHLISIHNCTRLYDFSRQWITHCSVQRQVKDYELDFITEWIEKYKKPVVIDEMCYEGNIEQCWGNISGEEMLRRMWKVFVLGGYPGHSECYFADNIWWSHGGKLVGESHKRFRFLHEIMNKCGAVHSVGYLIAENADASVRIQYFGEHRPSFQTLKLGDTHCRLKIIDTWDMTIEDKGIISGTVKIDLPQKQYMAILLTKI